MMRNFLIAFLFVGLTACNKAATKVTNEVTDNGIPFILAHMPEAEKIAVHVAWASDWSYRSDVNQAAPFVGADVTLMAGAEGYPPGEVGERFADLRSQAILMPSADHIQGVVIFDKEHMDETLQIVAAHLKQPDLDSIWFTRMRDQFSKKIREMRSKSQTKGFEAARWAVFGHQDLRIGLSLDVPGLIESMTVDDIKAWHSSHFKAWPEAIVIAGNVNAKEAKQALQLVFADMVPSSAKKELPVIADFRPRRILLHLPDSKVTQLAFIMSLPPTRMEGEVADILITNALGGGEKSILFDTVRTKLRASYDFSAAFANFTREHRLLVMTGPVEKGQLANVETAIKTAYEAYRKEPDPSTWQEFQDHFATTLQQNMQNPAAFAKMLLENKLDGYQIDRALSFSDQAKALTAKDIKARLTNSFVPADELLVIAVSPDANALPGTCVITEPAQAVDCP